MINAQFYTIRRDFEIIKIYTDVFYVIGFIQNNLYVSLDVSHLFNNQEIEFLGYNLSYTQVLMFSNNVEEEHV